jgi:hypothetical protein
MSENDVSITNSASVVFRSAKERVLSRSERRLSSVCFFCVCLTALSSISAEEPSAERKDPPRVAMCVPLAIALDSKTPAKLIVRGWNLEGVKELRSSDPKISFKVLSTSKATVPNGQDAKNVGDTQAEVEATVADGVKPGTTSLTVVAPNGDSKPYSLLVGSVYSIVADKESNDGFRQAQPIQLPQTIDGMIHDKRNVDVYSFGIEKDQRITIEILARRHGSALDSLLTLFNERGGILAINDDHDGSPDSRITTDLPAGKYLISLQDAHDHGGPAHAYRLTVRPASATPVNSQ